MAVSDLQLQCLMEALKAVWCENQGDLDKISSHMLVNSYSGA